MNKTPAALASATLIFGLTVGLTVGLTGCSNARHEAAEKYLLVVSNTKLPYWQTARAGLVQAGHKLAVGFDMLGPETYDPAAEIEQFRVAVGMSPTGILVSGADPVGMKAPIDAAIAKGIPVITIDSDVPTSKRLTFIGTNNYQAGLMGGRVLAEKMHDKGEIVVYTMPGQVNLDERLQGYKNIISDHPQMKIVRVVDVKGNPSVAFDTTEEILKAKTSPEGFVCLVSTACQEVADVLDRNKVDGKILVGMDADANTLTWIQKGKIAATIAQKPFTMALYGVVTLDSLYHYKLPSLDVNFAQDTHAPLPVFIDTGATLIDKSNVDAFVKMEAAGGDGK